MNDYLLLALLSLTMYLVHGYDVRQWWQGRGRKPTQQEIDELMRELDSL